MKKILLSLGTLAVVAAVVAGGTIAFYNDTETSTGNIFVAGAIDLKVDHLKQTYNGFDCETCSLEIYSGDGQNNVTDAAPGSTDQGPFPHPAVEVSNPHPNWANENSLPPAQWIWVDSSTSANDAANGAEYTFEHDFQWNGTPGGVDFDLALSSDNGYAIYLNGVELVDHLDSEVNYNATFQPLSGLETDFLNALQLGNNTLTIIIRNLPLNSGVGTPSTNPAGLLYRLNIQREDCEDDLGFKNACRLWEEKDLDQGDTFFNFGDIKPGDHGTNLISLHVYDNDAYACLITHDGVDNENTVYEPELPDTDDAGELQNYIHVATWIDVDGEGDYDDGVDTFLGETTLGDLGSIASLDGDNHLTATTTEYIGFAWCAGDFVDAPTDLTCNGNGMLNDAQSDSFVASLTAYAEQVRNNPNFSCEDVDLDSEENPT